MKYLVTLLITLYMYSSMLSQDGIACLWKVGTIKQPSLKMTFFLTSQLGSDNSFWCMLSPLKPMDKEFLNQLDS